MFEYFWIGIKTAWSIAVFKYIAIVFALYSLLWVRRLYIVIRSGGPFLAPYHIAKGNFYIHNGICFGKRIIPLKEISLITVREIPGFHCNGRRYGMYIERKRGKTITLFFGKTQKNDILIEKSKKEIKKLRRINID